MHTTFAIDKQFCGPPRSGNGGYVCGMIAKHFRPDCQVKLLVPPPLNCTMQLSGDKDSVLLQHGDTLVAKAHAHRQQALVPPCTPDIPAAEAAQEKFTGFKHHDLPTCFVCGPQRDKGDSLCIFPGNLSANADDGVAAVWNLADWLPSDTDNNLAAEFIWAALDCPGYFAVRERAGFALLGAFSAQILQPINPSLEKVIAMGWPITSEGRKHLAGTALIDQSGRVLAQAVATWISVPKEAFVDAVS